MPLHLNANDRFLTLSSPCTIAGTREGLSALLIGATLHMADIHDGGLSGIGRLIRDARITVLNSVPSVLRALAFDQPAIAEMCRDLRIVRIGGESLFWSEVRLLRRVLPDTCYIQAAYSSTEATGTQWFVPPGTAPRGSFVPVGYVLPGVDASIVDDAGRAVATGEVGELDLRGAYIAAGVWEEGELRAGAIRSDPANPAIRERRTGDLALADAEGLLTIVGRKDRQVKINGMRVEPAEIEAALRDLTEVADAAVVADRIGKTTSLTGFVVFHSGAVLSVRRLRALLRTTLPAPMRPARILQVGAIPRLPSGKVDAAALAMLSGKIETTPVKHKDDPPRGVASAVRRLWADVLGPRSLASGVSFEEAGGDSLKLLQLVLGLERLAGRRLKLDLFDPDMRMDDAVSIVGGMTSEDSDPEPRDRRPMVFLLPGLDGDEPRLAAFRAELTDEVRFSVIDYPDWPETAASGGGFDTVVASAVSTILAKQTSGPIMLAGYSYGGDVGFAAAVRLITLGRTVAFLGILDTDLYSLTAISGMFGQNRLQRRRRLVFQEMSDEGPGTGLGFLLAKFARDIVGLERVARHHHLWRWLLPLQTEFAFDRRMRRISRLREQWRRHDRATPASIDSRTRPGSGRAVTAVGEKFR